MRRFSRVSLTLAALVVLAGCASLGTIEREPNRVTFHVESNHPDATAVRVYCIRGRQLGVVRGVTMGREAKKTMRVGICRTVFIAVDVIGRRRAWTAEDYFQIQPDDVWTIRVEHHLPHTAWRPVQGGGV